MARFKCVSKTLLFIINCERRPFDDNVSIMLRMLQIFFPILMVFVQLSFSQESTEWSAYTSMREASKLFIGDDFVWVATSGGVLRYDRTSQTFVRFTRLNGLPSNEVSCMNMDEQGNMWFGTRYAGLGRLRKEKDEFDAVISDFKDLEINSLFSFNCPATAPGSSVSGRVSTPILCSQSQ